MLKGIQRHKITATGSSGSANNGGKLSVQEESKLLFLQSNPGRRGGAKIQALPPIYWAISAQRFLLSTSSVLPHWPIPLLLPQFSTTRLPPAWPRICSWRGSAPAQRESSIHPESSPRSAVWNFLSGTCLLEKHLWNILWWLCSNRCSFFQFFYGRFCTFFGTSIVCLVYGGNRRPCFKWLQVIGSPSIECLFFFAVFSF